jgi:hypothetical protein
MLVNFTSFNSSTQNGPPGRKTKELGCQIAPGPPARQKMGLHPGAKILVKRF